MAGRVMLFCIRRLSDFSRIKPVSVASTRFNAPALATCRYLPFRQYSETAEEDEAKEDAGPVIDPKKDRRTPVPVEVSQRYLQSKGFEEAYGKDPVWVPYRRNYKGRIMPETRKTCIRKGIIATGNPCPICRDEFLVLDYQNVELLKQFISPYSGEILPSMKTGLCQSKQNQLIVSIMKARDYGLLSFDVPPRIYDYSEYQ